MSSPAHTSEWHISSPTRRTHSSKQRFRCAALPFCSVVFAVVVFRVYGTRNTAPLRRQDPVECLFSFICSSNNNIPRITLMLDKLRRSYGELLLKIGEGGLAATGLFAGDSVRAVAETELGRRLSLRNHSRRCIVEHLTVPIACVLRS